MTESTTQRVTKASLRSFIRDTENEQHDWHQTGIPDVWQHLREFAGLQPLTRRLLLEWRVGETARLLNAEADPQRRREYRSELIARLSDLQEAEEQDYRAAEVSSE